MSDPGFVARNAAVCWTLGLAAVVLSGLLVGIEPVGGDPDRLYRPIKAELARSLAEGRLPFWSDRLGLGYPLAAESHAAAFYPPNQVLYRVLSVPTAYRLAMFLHYLLTVGATFAYARILGLSPPGAGLAALAFAFCGFQAIHSSHEVFYHALAYLPLCLWLGGRVVTDGGLGWTAALGLAYGLQLTVGHFQTQSWTAGLVVAWTLWRVVGSPRLARRPPLVLAGLAWGGAIAAVQLGPTWELARFVGFDDRSVAELAFYGFPPAHWAELAVPEWFRGVPGGPEAAYWYSQGTTGYEACLYVGTIPLIFAFLGLLSRGDAGSRFWTAAAALAFLLAILPTASPTAFRWATSIPGLGSFRAPGRFLAVTSLGLALLAGKGFDRARGRTLAWVAFGVALAFAAGAMAWVVSWSWRPDHVRELGGDRLWVALGVAAGVWAAAAVLVAAWLRGRMPEWILLVATAGELGALYYTSTTAWGWARAVPESSPILSRLAEERDVGKVAGMLGDVPLRIGAGVIYPYTGFPPLPPNDRFEGFADREAGVRLRYGRLGDDRRRFGATHGVWDVPIDAPGVELVAEGPDETLDRIAFRPPGSAPRSKWRLYRFAAIDPAARALPADGAASRPVVASVLSWDGRTATVEHDGPCRLVVNRTYYPGWTYRIDDGDAKPVTSVGGLQAADVAGAGTHRVAFTYRPTNLTTFAATSATATALALAALAWSGWRRRSAAAEQDAQD